MILINRELTNQLVGSSTNCHLPHIYPKTETVWDFRKSSIRYVLISYILFCFVLVWFWFLSLVFTYVYISVARRHLFSLVVP